MTTDTETAAEPLPETGTEPLPWQVMVLTLFPEMFPGYLGHSLAGKGLKSGIWSLETLDIRDFARDKHRSVDDTPFGGGRGMVMRPDVVASALDTARQRLEDGSRKGLMAPAEGDETASAAIPALYLSPRGRRLDQELVRELAAGPGVMLLCGRYEGVDQRLLDRRGLIEVSLGDFVLSGGEPAALALLDACIRLLPGVMGNEGSLEEESFESGLLEYPHYTRPQSWEGEEVPEVLTSGHHARIREWRQAQSEEITRQRRPDLWDAWQTRSRTR